MFGNLINNALSSAQKLSSYVMSVIQKDVQIYDASLNDITVAGLLLTGWETATISDLELTKEYAGMYKDEFAIVKQVGIRKLSVSILPTEISNKRLEALADACMKYNKYFIINITENGEWIADYKAQFVGLSQIEMSLEAENKEWEFYIIPTNTSIAQNQQFTNLPVAIEQ